MTDVLEHLKRVSGQNYIGNTYQQSAGGNGMDVIDPATETVIGRLVDTTTSELDDCIAQANAAQRDWWRNKSAGERTHAMHEVANAIYGLKPLLAEAMTREMG